MSPLQSIIRSISLGTPDIAIINDTSARLAEIGEIDRRCRPDGPAWLNQYGFLHLEVDRLADALAQAPSLEGASRLHAAICRHRDAGHSIEPIAACLRHASAAIIARLTPIVTAVFDQADAALEIRRKGSLSSAVQGDTMLVDVVGTINARAAQLAQQLAAEREAAAANPLQFLVSHIAPEVAPAPAPAPPPPLVRGKIKIGKAEPEPSIVDQLADEDEIDLEDPLSLLAGN